MTAKKSDYNSELERTNDVFAEYRDDYKPGYQTDPWAEPSVESAKPAAKFSERGPAEIKNKPAERGVDLNHDPENMGKTAKTLGIIGLIIALFFPLIGCIPAIILGRAAAKFSRKADDILTSHGAPAVKMGRGVARAAILIGILELIFLISIFVFSYILVKADPDMIMGVLNELDIPY